MTKENKDGEPLAISPLGVKAIGGKRSMKSRTPGRDARAPAKRVGTPKGVSPPHHTGQTAAASSQSLRSSLEVGATISTAGEDLNPRNVQGRFMSRSDRVKALRRSLLKREARLRKSMAYRPVGRPGDLERWDLMRADIALLKKTLADVLAGRDPPMGERTGQRTGDFPDAV